MTEKKRIFISHITEDAESAIKVQEFLDVSYPDSLDIFVASTWRSIAPGDDWFERIKANLVDADVMLVLCTPESVGRPWIQFESGAAWFSSKTTLIFVCFKGMTPTSLPQPMSRLQAIDVSDGEKIDVLKISTALTRVLNLPAPKTGGALLPESESPDNKATVRRWLMRPAAHVGNKISGSFRVGALQITDPDKAVAAGLDADDTLFSRLYLLPDEQIFGDYIPCKHETDLLDNAP